MTGHSCRHRAQQHVAILGDRHGDGDVVAADDTQLVIGGHGAELTARNPQDLPAAILRTSARFDSEVRALLEGVARAFRFKDTSCKPHNIQIAYADLEHAIFNGYHNEPPPRSRAVLAISSQMIELACRLLGEIKAASFSEATPVRK